MDDVHYFQKKLFKSLNVPVSRIDSESSAFSLGRATEITRDEIKFSKFITRMRHRFSHLFMKALEKQLVLKGIVTTEDWKSISQYIRFNFAHDNYFAELKETEVLNGRVVLANNLTPYVGKYFSNKWMRSNVFKQSDEEQMENDAELKQEFKNPIFFPPIEDQGQQK